MPLTEQEKLISDTLHYLPPGGSCFVVNEPGLKLISSDISFLPLIKSTLLEAAQDRNRRRFRGLGYVIDAFLVLSTKYAPDGLVPFILSLPREFQKEVVRTIPVSFQKTGGAGGYNFSVAPTRELIEFVRQLSEGEDLELQKAALRVLSRFDRTGRLSPYTATEIGPHTVRDDQ
jgi:hypothetical protein